MSEISKEKKMLTALAEKIKFKYKFLQFYQGLFMLGWIFFSVLMYKDVLQWNCWLKHKLLLLALSRLPNMRNPAFKKNNFTWNGEGLRIV